MSLPIMGTPWSACMQARDRLDLLPLRQLVTADGDAAGVFSRPGLLGCLSRPERYRIASHGSGGQILAAGERALAEAQVVLRNAYGASLHFAPATVHSFVDAATQALMVPVIFLRVDAPRSHARELQQLLAYRSAHVKDVEVQRDRVVMRAEMELSRSLGLERRILEVTDGAVHILSWLLRYEPAA